MIRPYSRFPYRSSYGYLFLAIMVLIMSWESQRADAAVAGGEIPGESIRLRILANSDSAADQAVKRVVRDAVVAQIDQWVASPQTIEEARSTILSHMGDIERVIADELNQRGFTYDFKAELGLVPFPTKIYGSEVYPAGNYEALRISLGKAEGQNWWCVLFPPLCFVDAVSGEAASPAATAVTAVSGGQDAKNQQAQQADIEAGNKEKAGADTAAEKPEVKFFIWELIQSIVQFFKNLFS
ncbi:stage II sporulation protein R [Paenibacillus nasutitermitis]|uniref:Stage II sporulation protein R n=1 Tax=Paenibacillus nasutitermitis TaxID=1652958 RepID=A0A917E1N0_9BACL|nr:stage II sporulation protein R [Paenibacillus nasutitermitis]GGD92865.1 hypothetical protein GCM10010911_59320 [Paenibacillus nasutitermitis]